MQAPASFLLQKVVKRDLRTFLLSLWPDPDCISTENGFFFFFSISFYFLLIQSSDLLLRRLVFVLLTQSM